MNEWDVAVIGPHFAGALLAVETTADRQPADRVFDYVMTYDRDRVLAVARALIDRVPPDRRGR